MHKTLLHKWIVSVLAEADQRRERLEAQIHDLRSIGKALRAPEDAKEPSACIPKDRLLKQSAAKGTLRDAYWEEQPKAVDGPSDDQVKVNSKLAKEKEREIIEAIEKAKAVLGEQNRLESIHKNELFEYRPEGMFPPAPKPISKQEKVQQIYSAYGMTSKPGQKPPAPAKKPVKPSESKYTFKKPAVSGIAKNPMKITTDTKQKQAMRSNSIAKSSAQAPQRSSSKQLQSNDKKVEQQTKPAKREDSAAKKPSLPERKVNRREADVWSHFQQAGELKPEDSIPQPADIEKTDIDSQAHTSHSIADKLLTSPQPRKLPNIAGSPETRKQMSSRLSQAVQSILRMKEPPQLSLDSHSLVNQIMKIDQVIAKMVKENEEDIALEEKRSNISKLAKRVMRDFRLMAIVQGRLYEQTMYQREEGFQLEDVLTRPIAEIPFIEPVKDMPALDSDFDNEEYTQICEFDKQGLFDSASEEYKHLIADLTSSKQSPAVQTLLAQLYSCWFYSEHFITAFHQLKETRQQAQNCVQGIVETLDREDIMKSLSVISPLDKAAVESGADNSPLSREKAEIETLQWIEAIEAEYYTQVRDCLLPRLKEKFNSLKALKGASREARAVETKSFLQDLQQAYKLFFPNSRLPLIFHSNFSPAAE